MQSSCVINKNSPRNRCKCCDEEFPFAASTKPRVRYCERVACRVFKCTRGGKRCRLKENLCRFIVAAADQWLLDEADRHLLWTLEECRKGWFAHEHLQWDEWDAKVELWKAAVDKAIKLRGLEAKLGPEMFPVVMRRFRWEGTADFSHLRGASECASL